MKKSSPLTYILKNTKYEYQKFHEKTKLKKKVRRKNPEFWPEAWKKVFYKSYARFEEIKLPKPTHTNASLVEVLEKRASEREFSKKPLTLAQLSNLLHYSAGLSPNKKRVPERRFYPSPGARYPLEIYVLSLNSQLAKSFYHYYVKNNSLEKMFNFNKKDLPKITTINWVKKAGCIIFITAIFERNIIKYGTRGYRNVLLEAGHLAQNIYLNACASDLNICAIGGYIDDNVNQFLELDGQEETVIYAAVVGTKI